MNKIGEIEIPALKQDAAKLQSGLGAVAWATLEMFRRGGMSENEISTIKQRWTSISQSPRMTSAMQF